MANYRVNLKYNHQRDKEIIDRLERQENKQDYIRRLILSDIAADHLLGLQEDIEAGRTADRIEYWEKHCPAVADPDYDCAGCAYVVMHWTTGDQLRGCRLEEEWRKEIRKKFAADERMIHKAKTHLNSLYGLSVRQQEVKEAFTDGNTHAVYEPVKHDVESFDSDSEESKDA